MNLKMNLFVFLIVLCVVFAITGVSAADDNQTEMLSDDTDYLPFSELSQNISDSTGEITLEHDYKYDSGEIEINKSHTFVINGNDHIIEGINDARALNIHSGELVEINNITFKNCANAVIVIESRVIFNNVKFINCSGMEDSFFITVSNQSVFNNCHFQMADGKYNAIDAEHATLIINNSLFDGGGDFDKGVVFVNRGNLIVENTTFANMSSRLATAINYKGWNLTIKKSKFINLHARLTGGAILGKFFPNTDKETLLSNDPYLIEDCQFINVTSTSDGGAIYFDMDSGSGRVKQTFNINNTVFYDCKSRYGGAIANLGGILNIVNSTFKNNRAGFEGGAVYTSWCNLSIISSLLSDNVAEKNAGAVYFDKGSLRIDKSNLTNNRAIKQASNIANTIYANDVEAYFSNSFFDNGGISVYANFASDSKIENITENDDIFLLDNNDYIVSVESRGIKLNVSKNSVNVDEIPDKFDLRDWGWASPLKVQGDNDDCWAFATASSLESSLLKATGVFYNMSENYVQKLQLKYVQNGDLRNSLTGFAYSGLGYALSWYGALPVDNDYDDRGVIADTDFDDERIHVQDAMIIFANRSDTSDLIKQAILKYGAVAVQLTIQNESAIELITTGDDIAFMDHSIHFISIIGWDDNYEEEFPSDSLEPGDGEQEGPGAWLVKDSLGEIGYKSYYSEDFLGTDYYAIIPQAAAICYIFENPIDYHVNYQSDLTGLTGFDENYTYYSNEFTSKYDEWIGAVGTYFNESEIEYSFDIYVNDFLTYSQSGVSEFAGFRTIVLNRYVPVTTGDRFKVVFKSNALPYQAFSRQHYLAGMSFVSDDGETWSDITLENRTVCLKVYTTSQDRQYYTFDELNQSICGNDTEINLEHDYMYDGTFISINKSSTFTINGNGHIIVGINESNAFNFDSESQVIINNLTFRDCVNTTLFASSPVVFNNVEFINCSNVGDNPFIASKSTMEFNNCTFHDMGAERYDVISTTGGTIILNNCLFYGWEFDGSVISVNRGSLTLVNTTFENITSRVGTAVNYKGWNLTVNNSKFINLHAKLSGGAIIGKFFPKTDKNIIYPNDAFLIENCEFINVTSTNDGGALYFDLNSGSQNIVQTLNLVNLTFRDCKSRYGGAIADQGGVLNIVNSTFENSYAGFEGGAIYTTWADLNIVNVSISNSTAEKNAGAIYFDKGRLTITLSNLTGNRAIKNSINGIYAHDVGLNLSNSTFDNGAIGIYADFAGDSKIENITRNEDIFSLNNTDYVVSVESNGIKLELVHNEIIVDKLPPKFDLRDWGWVTSPKVQGDNDDCWAFATVASIESALLKATGISYNLSQNYVQKLQLKYVQNGDLRISLTGFAYSGLGYALSWYGVLPIDGPYDDRGMIADTDLDDARIHVQDAMIIFGGTDDVIDAVKHALLKYGPVTVQMIIVNTSEELNTTGEDIAVMDHSIHFVSIIGWDDNESVWITKDSLTGFAEVSYDEEGFFAVDRYALVPQNAGICYIFENPIQYHVNYQTDLTALTGFDGNYTTYSNEFTSKYSELIGAVGTYFNESGIDYSFDIYVNGVKVHSQNGVSEFAGFRTIVLNKYVPVKAGDKFRVVFRNNALPYQAYSRQHYVQGMSYVSADGVSWSDITLENRTVCLKAYTVADNSQIISKDLTMTANDGSYFEVSLISWNGEKAGAGEEVTFTINGKTYTAKTDADGIARLQITENAGTYEITTSYLGSIAKNTVKINAQPKPADKIPLKITLKAAKTVKVKRTAKKLVLKATLKINGKAVKGKVVKFKFKGKTYRAKTNKKGVAKVTVKKNVIKKLKKGKKYTVKIIYLKKTTKTIVKV